MKNLIEPLSEQTYFILLSLRSEPKHGYAIAKMCSRSAMDESSAT
jgi:DNA-binding PadR family transcriptional regulator